MGDREIQSSNQIEVKNIIEASTTSLTLNIILLAGTWYQDDGTLSKSNSEPHNITIRNLKEPSTNHYKYPQNLEELRKTDPSWLSEQNRYDSRDFNIVRKSVENQLQNNTCWAYSTCAASETSILKEGINPSYVSETLPIDNSGGKISINLNEYNVDYLTNIRTKEADLLGLNQDDLFGEKSDLNVGNYLDYPANGLMQWNGPVNNAYSDYYQYENNSPFILEGYEIVPNEISTIKKAIAKYGAVAFAYNFKRFIQCQN